ncbi:Sensor histidine kinase RcsC [anaerobic digester metagenome]
MAEHAHLLAEIRENIARKDPIKARLVLAYLENVDRTLQEQVLGMFRSADPDFAVPILARFMSEHRDMVSELPVVREILAMKILTRPDLVSRAIRDPQTPFRKTYIAMAAELRLESVVGDLIDALLAASDVEELNQLIETLGEIGDPSATTPLSDFLYSGNRTLIISSTKALGKLGTPTAMLRLAERMGTDNQLDLLILDIFAKVQDAISLDKLNEAMRSHYAHLRSYAKKTLAAIGPKAVPLLTENLLFDDADLRVHTLNVLGDIGDPAAIAPIRKLLHNHPDNANVRFAAYEALGLLPLDRGAYVLTQGLGDPVEHVCIAAAKAIDRNFNEIMAAGIKNLAGARDEDAHRIIRTVISAQARSIFLSLMSEERFQDMAVAQLAKAHKDIRDFFYAVLKEQGYSDLALRLLAPETKKAADRKRICAVDDSRMILNIYKSTLHELGFEPVLFEFPAGALEWLEKNRPDMVLTDLNMPDITGIDLTRAIRRIFPKEELPVVMVTTQNEINDNRAALEAGVNDITYKPFTAESLKAVIIKFL